jgi:hypothetical protein
MSRHLGMCIYVSACTGFLLRTIAASRHEKCKQELLEKDAKRRRRHLSQRNKKVE